MIDKEIVDLIFECEDQNYLRLSLERSKQVKDFDLASIINQRLIVLELIQNLSE